MYERSTVIDIWTYREPSWSEFDLIDFDVEARDGHIGTVAESTPGTGASYLVVKTGPWIFGRKVLLPAGLIAGIDEDERKVFVDLTKEEISTAPEFDEVSYQEPSYREQLAAYYQNRPPGPDYGKDDRGPA